LTVRFIYYEHIGVYGDYNMEMEIDFSHVKDKLSKEEINEKIKRSMEALAMECEGKAKQIVADNSMDTGLFMNSIFTELDESGDVFSFTMYDGVSYGKYHEFGTIRHWLPFYYYNDTSKPVLADWGHRVLGLSEEEMLDMGGIEVEVNETMPFRKALIHAENEAGRIFEEIFSD